MMQQPQQIDMSQPATVTLSLIQWNVVLGLIDQLAVSIRLQLTPVTQPQHHGDGLKQTVP